MAEFDFLLFTIFFNESNVGVKKTNASAFCFAGCTYIHSPLLSTCTVPCNASTVLFDLMTGFPPARLIFICHAGEDKKTAKDVATNLQDIGCTLGEDVFLDNVYIKPGSHFINVINNVHAHATHMIILASIACQQKPWPTFEANRSGKRGQHVAVVQLNKTAAESIQKRLSEGHGTPIKIIQADKVNDWVKTNTNSGPTDRLSPCERDISRRVVFEPERNWKYHYLPVHDAIRARGISGFDKLGFFQLVCFTPQVAYSYDPQKFRTVGRPWLFAQWDGKIVCFIQFLLDLANIDISLYRFLMDYNILPPPKCDLAPVFKYGLISGGEHLSSQEELNILRASYRKDLGEFSTTKLAEISLCQGEAGVGNASHLSGTDNAVNIIL
eukprot:m.13091 g.13091  ORF g.13091 m.13091 type:complete len:383 (-) comp10037_c0_seq2:1027-2175(-)